MTSRSPQESGPQESGVALQVAAASSAVLGLGFGIPCALGIRHFASTGEVLTFMGYPTYGNGPFEKLGIKTSVPLLAAFLAVCGAEVVAGWLLWRRPRVGTRVSLALLPVEIPFWLGFALPYAPPLALARTAGALLAQGGAQATDAAR